MGLVNRKVATIVKCSVLLLDIIQLYNTIRAILSVSASEHLHLAQFDVKLAFLNGILKEEIYMQQSEGFSDDTGKVYRIQKRCT